MAVKVQFEIGHTSKLRSKKTPEGFTHDWEIYVEGVNKADISAFIDKVVFLLHESFPKPKRVIKEPPYVIQESGYAGFILPVEIFFRNRDEPKRVVYQYDLDLQHTGPPLHRVEVKTHVFESPSEEFRAKLMRGGGVPVYGANIGASSLNKNASPSVGESAGTESSMGKPKSNSGGVVAESGKKHKSRNDDSGKASSFDMLFGPPITKGSSGSLPAITSKHSPDGKPLSGSTKSGSHDVKEKLSKERDKTSSSDKARDKDKKDRHGRDKERKSSKSGDSNSKHDKDKEKSKKDKSRDKDREREREQSSSSAISASGASTTSGKRTLSPKTAKNIVAEISAPSPKKMALEVGGMPASRSKEREEHKSNKTESKEKERSSNKKSKKEKKDKDKEREREREKREEHKDKRTTKDERNYGNSPANANQQAPAPSAASNYESLKATGKATPTSVGSNSSSSLVSNSGKRSHDKDDASKPVEKVSEQKTDKLSSNNVNTDKKSHKHKKKEKSKDKEKERGEREKEKEREKDKPKEREKDKPQLPLAVEKTAQPSPKPETASPATSHIDATADKAATNSSSTSSNTSSSKKEKHKKSKEKSSSKEEKRQRDASDKADGKHAGKQQMQNKPPNNLDLSDMDSAQSAPDLAATSALAAATAATQQHSDSSNSSFPDLSTKSSQKLTQLAKSSATTVASPSTKESKASGKDHKARNAEKSKTNEKSEKSADKAEKPEKPVETKSDKPEKEDKKRNRRTSQNSNSGGGSTFIEPPVKPTKKEQNKAPREKSKSPSLRNAAASAVPSNTGFLQPPPSGAAVNNNSSPGSNSNSAVAVPAAGNINNNNNNNSNNNNNNSRAHSPADALTQPFSSSQTATPSNHLPTEYLSELQELHHKIMTLQDNEELQHVVELIAATGCYEITHKTFDFDLCKLDRVTVQRLQEFLATSVS